MTELSVAVEAARAAGAILRAHTERPRSIQHKGEVDLVTELDLACEHAILEVLDRRTPEIAVLAEETGGDRTAGTRWVVDPIDGTTNIVHGFPYYCVSVALEDAGQSVIGVLYEPIHDRLYVATRGGGATCNEAPLRVTERRTLRECLVGTGFGYDRAVRPDFYLSRFKAVMVKAQGMRRAGAAALDLAMVAQGSLDAYFEYDLKRWDMAAGVLLVEEAGGRVSAAPGGTREGIAVDLVATNPWVHDELVAALDEVVSAGG